MKGSLLALMILLAMPGVARAQWSDEQPLTMTMNDIYGEGVAASGTAVHVIYGNTDVRYRSSMDEGVTWGGERTLDSGVIHLTDPVVADGSDVWMIYLKDTQTLTDWCCGREVGDIYLLHSGDAGATWDPPRQLTTARGAFRVSLTYAANRLHIVWMDYRDARWDTYYLRSPDRGATWDPEKVIAASAGTFGAERPQVAARGDAVHVTIWDDRGPNPPCMAGATSFTRCPDTFYIGSLDGGKTWGDEIPVDYSGAAFSGRNDIAVAGDASVVVNFNRGAEGTADANPHMFVARSPDNGATWDPPVQLTNTPGSSDHGSIIGDGPSVFLAWHDSRSGALEIRYAHSIDEGRTWSADEKASTPTETEASTPLVALTAGYVHALWLDKRTGKYQVMYRRRARPVVPSAPEDAGTSSGTDAGGTGSGTGAGTSGTGAGGNAAADGDSSGCGCRTAGSPRGALVPVVLVGLAIGRKRRRSRRAPGS